MPIRRDKAGRLHVEVCVARRRIHRKLPADATTSDAKALEAEIRRQLAQPLTADVPLQEIMGHYTETYGPRLRGWERSKYAAYRIGPWIDGKRVSETRQVAAKITEDMQGAYAAGTINKSLGALSRALALAWQRGVTDQDYSRLVKRLPEHNARERVLTMGEVHRLADHASPAVRAAIWIGLYTGLRRGEIAGLIPAHIDLDSGMITIPAGMTKTRRTRTVPIATPARPWLDQVPLGLTPQGFRSGFDRARAKAGLPDVTIHDLRRSCGTMLIRAGVDLYVVSKILGHSSVAVTQTRYAHLAVKQLQDGMTRAFG